MELIATGIKWKKPQIFLCLKSVRSLIALRTSRGSGLSERVKWAGPPVVGACGDGTGLRPDSACVVKYVKAIIHSQLYF